MRVLLAGVLLALVLACLPASATATPRGHLAEEEYQVLLAAYGHAAALGEDITPAGMREVCAALTPRSTRLLAAEYAVCAGIARWMDAGTRFGKLETSCAGTDLGCVPREFLRLEKSTRAVARLVRAERRAVAARGLTGACARAFDSGQSLTMLDEMAGGLRDTRVAMLAGDERGVNRGLDRVERATSRTWNSGADSIALLRRCPRG
jgi:hypothetical protein